MTALLINSGAKLTLLCASGHSYTNTGLTEGRLTALVDVLAAGMSIRGRVSNRQVNSEQVKEQKNSE